MTSEICGSNPQNPGRFLQHSNRKVAGVAQNASNYAGPMVVVEIRSFRRASTDGADATLRSQDGLELGRGDAVVTLSRVTRLAFATVRSVVPFSDTCSAFTTGVSPKRRSGDPVCMAASARLAKFSRRAFDERVAVSLPAVMVQTAPVPTENVFVAVVNRTLAGRTLSSHQGAKTSLVWPAVVSSNRRLYCTGGSTVGTVRRG
jgi:hypothetical protein